MNNAPLSNSLITYRADVTSYWHDHELVFRMGASVTTSTCNCTLQPLLYSEIHNLLPTDTTVFNKLPELHKDNINASQDCIIDIVEVNMTRRISAFTSDLI